MALSPEEASTLKVHYKDLIDHLPHDLIKDALYFKGIITTYQWSDLDALAGDKEQNKALLVLVLQHKDGYKTLLDALNDSRNPSPWICEHLRSTYKTMFMDT